MKPLKVAKPLLRGKVWSVKVKVTIDGKQKQVWRTLETTSAAEARRRAPIVAAQIKSEARQLEAERVALLDPKAARSRQDQAHRDWWEAHKLPAAKAGGFYIPDELEPVWDATVDEMLGQPLPPQQGDIRERYDPEREAATQRFIGETLGHVVPAAMYVERYLKENADFSPSYESRVRRSLKALEAWLVSEQGADNIKSLNRRQADRFLQSLEEGRTAQTVNSLGSALSGYWVWMERRGLIDANPWRDLSRKNIQSGANAQKRPFSDEEVKALLIGDAAAPLRDAMFIAALTGLRMTEIGRLKVADVQGGNFNIRASKTAAGMRAFPIHSALKALIEARTSGKSLDAYLIDGLPSPSTGQKKRGYSLSRDFRDHQKRLGTYARQEGRKQGDVDFHSFRRWFATKAEQAGQMPNVIAYVMGHTEGRQHLSLKSYSAGPSMDQEREVIESIRLPQGVTWV